MEQLWAPWRMQYIQLDKPAGCILCDKPGNKDDEASYILYRGKYNFVMLNLYPYNSGHLMVAPYQHAADLAELSDAARHEHIDIISQSIKILKEALHPDSFNVGANLGRVAGAGIDEHFHTHVVPRWNGDTNFMPIVADTKVVNEALAETYHKLKGKF